MGEAARASARVVVWLADARIIFWDAMAVRVKGATAAGNRTCLTPWAAPSTSSR